MRALKAVDDIVLVVLVHKHICIVDVDREKGVYILLRLW